MVKKKGENFSSNNINKLILKKNTYESINKILSNTKIIEKEVYTLIRNFFKEYFELNYEFTNHEIKRELKKFYLSNELKEDIKNLFDRLSQLEYLGNILTQQELKNLILDFKSIINKIITVHYKKETSFMKKLVDSIHHIFSHSKNIHSGIKKVVSLAIPAENTEIKKINSGNQINILLNKNNSLFMSYF